MRSLKNAFCLSIAIGIALTVLYFSLKAGRSGPNYNLFSLLAGRPVAAAPVIAQSNEASELIEPEDREPIVDLNSMALLEQVNRSLADLTESVVQSVVSIDTTTTIDVARYVPVDPFGFFGYRRGPDQQYRSPGLGSGVIVSESGYVLTNHHVVANVDEIQITTHGGEKFQAEWIGSDETIDIAVLKIQLPEGEGREFRPLAFGDSDQTRVGEMALAIGNPFGLSETVTRGIISAKQRQLSDGANQYLQVDAVINPGNSGGPLVNVRGEIIGINVALFTGQQDVRVWQGVGLAVPSNEAREVYEAIVLEKPLLRGYIGVNFSDISVYMARRLGLNSTDGAIITEVAEGSPAEDAGILPGDIIRKFGEFEVKSADDALLRIRRAKAGNAARLGILRQGKAAILEVAISEKPDTAALKLRRDIAQTGREMSEALGFRVRNLKPNERTTLGLEAETPAIIITEVEPASQATQRFRPGDLIHAIDQEPVTDVETFYDLLGSLTGRKRATMLFTRNGQRLYAVLTPGG